MSDEQRSEIMCKCGGVLELVPCHEGDAWFRFEITHRKDGSKIEPSFLGVVGLGKCQKCGKETAMLDSYTFPEAARLEWQKFPRLDGGLPKEVAEELAWKM